MHLERLTMILEIVGRQSDASVADICDRSDLPKPTVYRLVQDLVSTGLLEPIGKGRFVVGTRLKRIARNDHSDRALMEVAGPALKSAAEQHGVCFFLSRLRLRAVEIIHVETPDTGVSYLHPGLGKRPLHACSCSKAVAAFSPGLLLTSELKGRLKAYTEFTLTSVNDLHTEFETIRKRGYAECVEEIERGMCSVAAPLGQSEIGRTLSIGATGSVRVFDKNFRAMMGKELVALSESLTNVFGWNAVEDERQSV